MSAFITNIFSLVRSFSFHPDFLLSSLFREKFLGLFRIVGATLINAVLMQIAPGCCQQTCLWFLLLCFILLMSLKAANCPRTNWTINSQSLPTLSFHLVGPKSSVACGHGGDRKTAPFRWRDGKQKWVLREASILEGLEKKRQLLFGWLHPKRQHQPVYGKKRRG